MVFNIFSEPEIREILVSYTFFPNQFGTFLALLLNNFLPWRTVALISFTVPLITAALIYLVCFCSSTSLIFYFFDRKQVQNNPKSSKASAMFYLFTIQNNVLNEWCSLLCSLSKKIIIDSCDSFLDSRNATLSVIKKPNK